MENIAGLLPLILIGVVFYLLLLRPARNKQREVRRLQEQAGVGARVVTTAGLYGVIVALDEQSVVLDTAVQGGPAARSRWARGAIGRILEPASGEPGVLGEQAERAADDGSVRSGTIPAGIDLTKAAPHVDNRRADNPRMDHTADHADDGGATRA